MLRENKLFKESELEQDDVITEQVQKIIDQDRI